MRKAGIVILILAIVSLLLASQAIAQQRRSYEADYGAYSERTTGRDIRIHPFSTQRSANELGMERLNRDLRESEAADRYEAAPPTYYGESETGRTVVVPYGDRPSMDRSVDRPAYRTYGDNGRTRGYYEERERTYRAPTEDRERRRTVDPRTQPFGTQGSGEEVVGEHGEVASPEEPGYRYYPEDRAYRSRDEGTGGGAVERDDRYYYRDRYGDEGRVDRYYGEDRMDAPAYRDEGTRRYNEEDWRRDRIDPRTQPFGTRRSY